MMISIEKDADLRRMNRKKNIRLRVCLFGYINRKFLSLDKYLGHHESIAYRNTFLSSNKFVYLFTIVRSQWAFRVLLFKS